MVHLVTGYAGTEHITSADQGSFNASFFGTGEYVMEAGRQFAASVVDNNTVRVFDGDMLMHGRHIRINPDTYEDMTIQIGTAGKNRIDLICMTYEKNAIDGTEMAYLEVVRGGESAGNPGMPEYVSGNILEGAEKNQMPLYSVSVSGVVLSGITCLFQTVSTYKTMAERYEREFVDACRNYLGSLTVFDAMKDVESNEKEKQIVGALALKEYVDIVGKALEEVKKIMVAATANAAGKAGLVPAPAAGAANRYLRSDATWSIPPDTTYGPATQTANGLMSAADKKKLDTGGQGYTIIDELNSITQLNQNGEYLIGTINEAFANGNITDAANKLTDWNTGDFHALLLTHNVSLSEGCNFGTLILTSPRWREGSSQIWIGTIWGYKIVSWKKIYLGNTIADTLVLSKTTDASGTANNYPALIVGGTVNQQHLEIDGNEIMSKSNATTPQELLLNSDGGRVFIGTGGLFVNGETYLRSLGLWDGVRWRNNVVQILDDGDGDLNYGSELIIQGSGNAFIGAGEAPWQLKNTLQAGLAAGEIYTQTGETFYLTSDGSIFLYTSMGDVANRKGIIFDQNGILRPLVDGQMYIGSNNIAWNGVFSRLFCLKIAGQTYDQMDAPIIGTPSTVGIGRIALGNDRNEGTDKNARGQILLWHKNTCRTTIDPSEATKNIGLSLPSDSGTLARTADNVASASKWKTARTIGITGDVVGSASIDGSADKNISVLRRGCIVGRNDNATTNPYYKFASITGTDKNFDSTITFKVTWGHNNVGEKTGILTAHIRINSNNIVGACEFVWETAVSGVDLSKFKIAYNTTEKEQWIAELWAVIDLTYAQIKFDVIAEGTRTERSNTVSKWVLYNNVSNGSASAITSGLAVKDSTLATLKNPIAAASASAGGMVTTGTQTFAGAKTFNGAVTFNSTVRAANNGRVVALQSSAPSDTGMLWAW